VIPPTTPVVPAASAVAAVPPAMAMVRRGGTKGGSGTRRRSKRQLCFQVSTALPLRLHFINISSVSCSVSIIFSHSIWSRLIEVAWRQQVCECCVWFQSRG
jgi:hypothetical protein